MRVLPAGLGDQHRRPAVGIEPCASCRLIELRHLGRAGEHHAGDRADWPTSARRRPRRRRAGAAAPRAARRPRAAARTACGGDQRRLLGRLGDHRVAGGQRGRDLAGEDRQREVPRADAGHRRPSGRCVSFEQSARPAPRSSAGSRPPRAPRRRHWRRSCRPRARSGPAAAACAPPSGRPPRSQASRRAPAGVAPATASRCGAGRVDHAQASASTTVPTTSRRSAGLRTGCASPSRGPSRQHRRGAPAVAAACSVAASAASALLVGEIEPARIRARGAEQVARQRRSADAARRPAACAGACSTGSAHQRRRAAPSGSAMLVDERGVGAVLQQAAHQIGQQRLVRADRRIDAARPVELVAARRPPRTAARPCRAGTGTRTGRHRSLAGHARGSRPG